jgi:hypothetical protein
MLKQKALILSSISIGVFLLLFLLVRTTAFPNKNKNGFTRKLRKAKIELLSQNISGGPYADLCGVASTNIFLSVANPQYLIMKDKNSFKETIFFMPVPKNDNLINHALVVDSPVVYFFANNVPALYYGHLYGNRIDSIHFQTNTFSRSAFISSSSTVICTYDSSLENQTLEKINMSDGKIQKQSFFLKSFSNDGILKFDKASKRIFFLQYYGNQFWCLDTNLNLLYTSRTIDTTSTNPVSINKIVNKTETHFVPAKARKIINSTCYAENGFLFVVSKLKADNEINSDFENNSVIDVYAANTGSYYNSFYIPDVNGEKMSSLLIQGHLIFALYEKDVAIYDLPSGK